MIDLSTEAAVHKAWEDFGELVPAATAEADRYAVAVSAVADVARAMSETLGEPDDPDGLHARAILLRAAAAGDAAVWQLRALRDAFAALTGHFDAVEAAKRGDV